MKLTAIAGTVFILGLCACGMRDQKAQAEGHAAPADPVLTRIAKDFPADRFEFVGPSGSAISLLLDRTSGCMYNGQKGTPILDGNGNPDCGYKPQ